MDTAFDLQTWEQAFEQYSISTTRTIERQLRASVANNRKNLRVLVGGNYRELLSTAEQIVSLNDQVSTTESHISGIGQQCKPPSQQARNFAHPAHRRVLAQLRLLQRCIAVAISSLGEGNLTRSAQIIVISRLLVKSLTGLEESPKSLPALRGITASLRRQLLRRVDAVLTHPRSTLTTMVHGSCAYCLVTSAAFQDVFKHASRLRLDRLRKHLEQPIITDQHVVEGLRYYITTLRLLESLAGRNMIDALGSLQKRPILQESSIIDLELLDLKGIIALIPEEIRTFIPYFKRTPFSVDEVREAVLTWSSDAAVVLAKGLERLLLDNVEIVHVLKLRRILFAVLLPVYFSVPGSSAIQLVLHRVFSERIDSLTKHHVNHLQGFSGIPLSSSLPESGPASLWQKDFASTSLNSGAASFLQQIPLRRRGITRSLDITTRSVNAWILTTTTLLDAFQELQKIRWRDRLEEPDEEQEDEADQIIKHLSKGDPQLYSTQMNQAMKYGFQSLENGLVMRMTDSIEEGPNVQMAVHHLRTIRELVIPLRQAFPETAGFQELDRVIPRIQRVIAAEVVSKLCAGLDGANTVEITQNQSSIENLPSPRAFGFLDRLCTAMFEVGGTDVWSPTAVRVLKNTVAEKVFANEGREIYVESAFDAEYVAIALDSSASALAGSAEEKTAAREYWGRTKLLFGVLASV